MQVPGVRLLSFRERIILDNIRNTIPKNVNLEI